MHSENRKYAETHIGWFFQGGNQQDSNEKKKLG